MSDPDDDTTSMTGPVDPNAPALTRPCLVVLTGSTAGHMYRLDKPSYTLGRGGDCDIRFEDDNVSRAHAELIVSDDQVTVRDLKSRNGTFRNNDRITETALHNGDRVRLGRTVILKFTFSDALDEALQKNLYELATTDGLTGLFNRRFFLDAVRKEIANSNRHERPMAVVLIDVDHFKRVNDAHGHLAGDHVLRDLASVLADEARAEDVVARYGGEEFALLLRECTLDAAMIVAERMRRAVAAMRLREGAAEFGITISAGVAAYDPLKTLTAESLIAAADNRLYTAKTLGRNRVEK
jgi:two-component system, cell cycle response regulator